MKTTPWELVYTPDLDSDFRIGACFAKFDIETTAQAGHFMPSTMFKHVKSKRALVVVQKKNGTFCVEELKYGK